MTVIVKGHGARTDDKTTFVPVGTTLRFYSGFDVDLATTVALVAIATGVQAAPSETIAGTGKPDDVTNYVFGTQDDGFYAKWLALGGESGVPIWWVGNDNQIKDGDRLCNDPDNCVGTHTCTGVLGKLKDVDTDIVIMACRGYTNDKNSKSEGKLEGFDVAGTVNALVTEILDLARQDPDAAEKKVDDLPQEQIALMINRLDYSAWQKARYLKEYANAGDLTQLFGHLKANSSDLDRIMGWLVTISGYGQALDSCAAGDAESFVDTMNSCDTPIRNALLQRASISNLRSQEYVRRATLAKDLAEAGKWAEMFALLDKQSEPSLRGVVKAFNDEPAIGQALDQAAASDNQQFLLAYGSASGPVQEAIGARPGIKEAAKGSTWSPSDKDYDVISEINARNIKATDNGGTLPIAASGVVVAIGDGFPIQVIHYIERQGDTEKGTLTVTKAGPFSKGGIEVTGISSAKQSLVKSLIEEFSEKKVTFS
jgi:hypothetical protein